MTEKQKEKKWDSLRASFVLFQRWDKLKGLNPEKIERVAQYFATRYTLETSVLLLEYIRLSKMEKESKQ